MVEDVGDEVISVVEGDFVSPKCMLPAASACNAAPVNRTSASAYKITDVDVNGTLAGRSR